MKVNSGASDKGMNLIKRRNKKMNKIKSRLYLLILGLTIIL